MKKYSNVEQYLFEMFGEEFVKFCKLLGEPLPENTKERKEFINYLTRANQEIFKFNKNKQFPDSSKYHHHVKEIFALCQAKI